MRREKVGEMEGRKEGGEGEEREREGR